jgi:hypothetical protein
MAEKYRYLLKLREDWTESDKAAEQVRAGSIRAEQAVKVKAIMTKKMKYDGPKMSITEALLACPIPNWTNEEIERLPNALKELNGQ